MSELPKGWVECALDDISRIQSGGTPSRSKKEYWNGDIPWVKISDIKTFHVTETEEFISESGLQNSSARLFPPNTILFTIFATIGKVGILDIDAATNQAISGITVSKEVLNQYILYALVNLSEKVQEGGKGVAQKNINLTILKKTKIPLPPLAEQERIVEKLDALFASLDVIKDKLDRIPELLKNFRQQVLTQAVTGKLTEEWREGKDLNPFDLEEVWRFKKKLVEKGEIKKERVPFEYLHEELILYNVKNWVWCRMIDVSTLITDGKHGDCKDEAGSGYYFLSVKNMVNGSLEYSNGREITEKDFQEVHQRTNLEAGDVLISSTGATIGKIVVAQPSPLTQRTTFQKSVAIVKNIKSEIDSDYLSYYLKSNMDKIRGVSIGSAQPNLLLGDLKRFPVIVPPLEEQQEIVRRVEALFAIADRVEAQYTTLKEKVDQLPQAILAKAFRGELVEQPEEDEPASVLLERIKKDVTLRPSKGKTSKPYPSKESKLSQAAEERGEYGG